MKGGDTYAMIILPYAAAPWAEGCCLTVPWDILYTRIKSPLRSLIGTGVLRRHTTKKLSGPSD